jgi:hypothetical protein
MSHVHEVEKFSVDGTCNKYAGDEAVANHKLWLFIRESARTRAECREFFQSIGVAKNTSQRTSSALNWLRLRGYIRSNRAEAAVEIQNEPPKPKPPQPLRVIRYTQLPRTADNNIDMVALKSIMAERNGHITIGPRSAGDPKAFIDAAVSDKPNIREGAILVAARNTGKARWDQVRDALHKEYKHLCDCQQHERPRNPVVHGQPAQAFQNAGG